MLELGLLKLCKHWLNDCGCVQLVSAPSLNEFNFK